MKYILIIFIFSFQFSQAQENDQKVIDSLYREDQFYLSFTYNAMVSKSTNLSSPTTALGFNVGFLRDFPINKSRTWAVAPGLGLGCNFNNTIKTPENIIVENKTLKDDFTNFSYLNFDFPLEIRWRDSNPTNRDFLRVYSGFKISYLHFFALENINSSNLNNIQYGPYLSIGYGTWNFYFHYTLNPVFKNNFIQYQNNGNIENYELATIRNIHAGLIFYIL